MAGNNIMDLADLTLGAKKNNGAQKNRVDPKPFIDMVMGFQKSQIIYTATSLGVFEEIAHAVKPMTSDQLCCKLQIDQDATSRLLNGCVVLGLLQVIRENETNMYTCSPMTNMLLLKSSRMSMRPLILQIGGMYKLWGQLPDIVQNGQCEASPLFGDNYFEEGEGFYTTEMKQIDFMQAMHMFSRQDSPHILKQLDLKPYTTACDLGGGTGAIAKDIAGKHPTMQVSVLELPHVVRVAEHFNDTVTPPNFQFIEGDFFEDPLPPADLYILSNVIHDWSQERIDQLLRKVYDSLDKGGAVLILEKILNESKTGPNPAVMMDLNMLVGCEGKERTADEYRALLKRYGFNSIQVCPVPMAMYRDAILAKKI